MTPPDTYRLTLLILALFTFLGLFVYDLCMNLTTSERLTLLGLIVLIALALAWWWMTCWQ